MGSIRAVQASERSRFYHRVGSSHTRNRRKTGWSSSSRRPLLPFPHPRRRSPDSGEPPSPPPAWRTSPR
uniref:Uncharacterized protein n=1 Tax=Oryza meridionalis TaxID=40149 RepID=A0A0E0CX24_9ORYZ